MQSRPPAPRCSRPARPTTTTTAEGPRGGGADAVHRHAADDPAGATILTTARDIHRITVAFSAGRISAAPHRRSRHARKPRRPPPSQRPRDRGPRGPVPPGSILRAPRHRPAGIAVDPSTPTTHLGPRRGEHRPATRLRPAGLSRPPHIPEESRTHVRTNRSAGRRQGRCPLHRQRRLHDAGVDGSRPSSGYRARRSQGPTSSPR